MTDLTAERVRELLHYDPETGVFTWRVRSNGRIPAGSLAGTIYPLGYVVIRISRRSYQAHRLAWLYVHGVWPVDEIDHISGIAGDNRIVNLRESTRGGNNRNKKVYSNNALGIKGLCYREGRRSPWQSYIHVNGTQFTKHFNHPFAALGWLYQTRQEHHGEFANNGL